MTVVRRSASGWWSAVLFLCAILLACACACACGATDAPFASEPNEPVATSAAALGGASDVLVWTQANVTPPVRSRHALAYDTARGRVVLFGGLDANGVLDNDTWEWDGTSWANMTPLAGSPPARQLHALAYDASRGRVVLFGGSGNGIFNDTWEWDGTSWANKTPVAGSPPARDGHALAYDASRGRVVLFGGIDSDTWEWDGASWANKTPAAGSPPRRSEHALAYVASGGRVVLFGGAGRGFFNFFNDTWEWDGTAWANKTPAVGSPPARQGHALAYDASRGRVVLFGGYGNAILNDAWEWNGTAWANKTPATGSPPARYEHALAYDASRRRVVLFGGNGNDTWEWDGTAWANKTPATGSPSARFEHALAYDASRRRVVLFGGFDNETWEWDGASWTNKTPAAGSPPARYQDALAYDAARGRVVLFGGYGNGNLALNDTWEWDGTSWTNKSPAAGSPPGRSLHGLAYDAARGRVVLFGGSGNASLSDTWEWDGASWTNKTPAAGSPPARVGDALAYDAARGRVVLFGGLGNGSLNDTWERDGTSWTNKTPVAGSPPVRYGHALAYDAARGHVVLFGGYGIGGLLNDTWLLSRRGGTCTTAANSTTGFCVDGVSCESSKCFSCEACNTAGNPGRCAPVIFDDDPDTCGAAQHESCDRQGVCKVALGQPAQNATECASGHLLDGVCCDSASCGPCQTCNAAEKEIPDNNGHCGTQKVGTDKKNDCASGDPSSCKQNGACDGRGQCQLFALGTRCGAGTCSDNRAVGLLCTGAGACTTSAHGIDCAPYLCSDATGCPSSCASDAGCVATHRCDAGKCVSKEEASCDGDHTLIAPNGTKTDCAPFKCEGATCKATCNSIADCTFPNECTASTHACVPPLPSSGDASSSGCALTPSSPSTSSSSWRSAALLAVAMSWLRRRRRSA